MNYGSVWDVTTPVPAGGSLTLTTGDDYYFPERGSHTPLPVEANVYALVDRSTETTYGAVKESGGYSNLFGPVTSTAGVISKTARIGGQSLLPTLNRGTVAQVTPRLPSIGSPRSSMDGSLIQLAF